MLKGSQAKFMTKELSKSTMKQSRYKNKYCKWLSRKNFLAYKKQKLIFNSLNQKVKKQHFQRTTASGVMGNKKFWNRDKPFLSSKSFIHNEIIN